MNSALQILVLVNSLLVQLPALVAEIKTVLQNTDEKELQEHLEALRVSNEEAYLKTKAALDAILAS